MTHASLFSGIGGFDLAAEWAGWENLFNCEIDPFCKTVLKYHFPNAIQYSDIKTTDFEPWYGRVNVLTGGFPCQPFSTAGKRLGTKDERNLWPEMLRAIREIKPEWIVGENVRGIINWSNGMVFEQVCLDLEAEGYEVLPLLLPACSVSALHERYRVWFVAHSKRFGLHKASLFSRAELKKQIRYEQKMPAFEAVKAHDIRAESYKYGVVDGIPVGLDECSLHAYGNAIVPQLAYQIFKTINQYNTIQNESIHRGQNK